MPKRKKPLSQYESMSRDELVSALKAAERVGHDDELAMCRERERILLESEKRYRGIFENFIDGYYRADMEGNLILASPSTARLFGYDDPEEIVGKSIAQTFWAVPEEREKILGSSTFDVDFS